MGTPLWYVFLLWQVTSINLGFDSHPQYTTLSPPAFHPPLRATTKVAYAVAEAEMVFTLMMYHLNKHHVAKGELAQVPFHLSNTQCAALEELQRALTPRAGMQDRKQAFYNVLFSLYLEDQALAQAVQTFTSPVAAYFALRCWDDLNGTFINIRDIPVALAKLQYSIRLRCSHKILLSLTEQKMGEEWME